ncbi:glutaredoxin domain-containing protein [Bdellovibrionota bacterium FG-2]
MNPSNKITVYTSKYCPYCVQAKRLLKDRGIKFEEILIADDDDAAWNALTKRSGLQTVPQIFAGDRLIGGYSDLEKLLKSDPDALSDLDGE